MDCVRETLVRGGVYYSCAQEKYQRRIKMQNVTMAFPRERARARTLNKNTCWKSSANMVAERVNESHAKYQ